MKKIAHAHTYGKGKSSSRSAPSPRVEQNMTPAAETQPRQERQEVRYTHRLITLGRKQATDSLARSLLRRGGQAATKKDETFIQ